MKHRVSFSWLRLASMFLLYIAMLAPALNKSIIIYYNIFLHNSPHALFYKKLGSRPSSKSVLISGHILVLKVS